MLSSNMAMKMVCGASNFDSHTLKVRSVEEFDQLVLPIGNLFIDGLKQDKRAHQATTNLYRIFAPRYNETHYVSDEHD